MSILAELLKSTVLNDISYTHAYFRAHVAGTVGVDGADEAGGTNGTGVGLIENGDTSSAWGRAGGWYTGQAATGNVTKVDDTATDNLCRLDTLVGGHLFVSIWVETSDVVAATAANFMSYGHGKHSSDKVGFRIGCTATTPEIVTEVFLTGGAAETRASTATQTVSTPQHVLLDMDVSAGQVDFTVYLDGASAATDTATGTLFGAISGAAQGGLNMGSRNAGAEPMQTDQFCSDLLILRVPSDVSAKVPTLATQLYKAGRTDLPRYIADTL